jgi:hypothetical protein
LRTRKMTLCLHRNGNRWEINPFFNNDARLIQHSDHIVLILNGIGDFDNAVLKALGGFVDIEAGVVNNRVSPVDRAVQLKELIVRPPHVVIYCLESEIIEVQRKRSLDERVVIESNQNYRFFATPESLNITDQRGVVADSHGMSDHCKLRPPDCLL